MGFCCCCLFCFIDFIEVTHDKHTNQAILTHLTATRRTATFPLTPLLTAAINPLQSKKYCPTHTTPQVVIAQVVEVNTIPPKNNQRRIPHPLMLPKADVLCSTHRGEELVNFKNSTGTLGNGKMAETLAAKHLGHNNTFNTPDSLTTS